MGENPVSYKDPRGLIGMGIYGGVSPEAGDGSSGSLSAQATHEH